MNNTNRGLNRVGIFLFGLVLLLVGGGVAVAAAVPDWYAAWKVGAKALSGLPAAITAPGYLLLIALVAIILIVLLLVAIFRQGHGRTPTLVVKHEHEGDDTNGSERASALTIDSSIAEQSIGEALRQYTGLASSSVSTYSVKGVPTLKIAVSARRGVSPRDISDQINDIVRRWDAVLGEEIPVFVKINGGFASRVAKTTRLPEKQTA